MGFEIRRAAADEADEIAAIARAAKRHWGEPVESMRLWEEQLAVTPEYVASHAFFVAVDGAEVLGYCAFSGEGETQELDELFVAPLHMGKRIGAALMAFAMAGMRKAGAKRIQIVSNPNAEAFYLGFGARRVGMVPSRPPGQTLPVLVIEIAD